MKCTKRLWWKNVSSVFVPIQNFVFFYASFEKCILNMQGKKLTRSTIVQTSQCQYNVHYNMLLFINKSWLLMQDQDNNPTNNLCIKLADISVFTCYDIVRVNHSRWKISFVRVEHWNVAHRNIMWQRNAFSVWEWLWIWCFH